METIKITVTGAQAQVENAPVLTCGMVGVPVELTFDTAWDGLQKTLVYKAGGLIRDQVGVENAGTVPGEMLQIPYRSLQIGVYGASADGALVIPTVWANAGQIREGANPSGDTSTQPALPVWQQLLSRMEALDDRAVKTVNGNGPDDDGNVQIEAGGGTADYIVYVEKGDPMKVLQFDIDAVISVMDNGGTVRCRVIRENDPLDTLTFDEYNLVSSFIDDNYLVFSRYNENVSIDTLYVYTDGYVNKFDRDFATDETLSIEGCAADAKAVGERLGDISAALDHIIALQEELIGT